MLTPWCASSDHYLILIVLLILKYYLYYISLGFPFIVSTMRLIYLMFPWTNKKINTRFLQVCIPLIFLSPVLSTFWMFPARGECRQLREPYPFGSVFVHYTGEINGVSARFRILCVFSASLSRAVLIVARPLARRQLSDDSNLRFCTANILYYFQMRNTPFFLANISFWLGITIVINILVLIKLLQTTKQSWLTIQNKSKKRKTAEISITLTIASMIVSCGMSGICSILYLSFPHIASYLAIIRPLGSDCDLVIPPWVFYLTHPTFQQKPSITANPASVSNVSVMNFAVMNTNK